MPEGESPKIIIDSDWKTQAQAEKEKLSAQTAAKEAERAPEGPTNFEDVVGWLATQALMYMGYFPDPQTGQAMISLEHAKLHIDMLGVLEEKTKGNLTDTEQKAITKAVVQLRSEFVAISAEIAKAIKEGKIKPRSAPGAAASVASAIQPPSGLATP